MNVLKLSELEHRMDKHGVSTVIINKDTVLKISPPEIFTLCIEMVKRLFGSKLAIPVEILEKIHDSIGVMPVEEITNNILTSEIQNDTMGEVGHELSDDEDSIVSFVYQFVNGSSTENTFYKSELNQVAESVPMERVVEILLSLGYEVSFPDDRRITVRLMGAQGVTPDDEGKRRDQQEGEQQGEL